MARRALTQRRRQRSQSTGVTSMPYRAGAIGVPWHNCDRCGIMTRVSQLVFQNGMFVCTVRGCLDNPEGFNRHERIAEVLSDGKTEPNTGSRIESWMMVLTVETGGDVCRLRRVLQRRRLVRISGERCMLENLRSRQLQSRCQRLVSRRRRGRSCHSHSVKHGTRATQLTLI